MRLIGERDLLCLDWDERLLRVVNAGFSRGEPFVRNAFAAAIPAGLDVRDPASMGGFIRKTLAEHRVRTRWVLLAVPRQDAMLTLLNLPKGSTDEVAAMVHMQVGREMHFARDQAVIDFAVGRMEDNSPTCEVWAAAIRTSLVDHLEQVIAAAGLRIARMGLRTYANLVAVKAAVGELPTRTVTVDVGPAMTEINVIRDNRLVFSRAALVAVPALAGGLMAPSTLPPPPVAGDEAIPFVDDPTPRPKALDSLLVEVSRTIEAYRATDPGARVDRIILAGSGGITPPAAAAFESRFGVPTEIFEPPQSMRWDSPDAAPPAPFSAVIGLALSGTGESLFHFDFAHPKEPEAEHRERVKRVPMLAVAVSLFLAAGLVLAWVPIRTRNQKIETLRQQIKSADADVKQREELAKQMADVKGWQARSMVWLDTIHQIVTDVYTSNKDAYLTSLRIEENGVIKLELAAADNKVASEMVRNAHKMVTRDKAKKTEERVYSSWPGDWDDSLADPKYPVKDEVWLQVNALQKRPKR